MRDIATQAYINYLHDVIKNHEDIQAQKDEMIKLLEQQIKNLSRQFEAERLAWFHGEAPWNTGQG